MDAGAQTAAKMPNGPSTGAQPTRMLRERGATRPTAGADRAPAEPRVRCAHRGMECLVNIDSTLLLLITPILLIQLGLLIWGLYDLTRPGRRVKGDSKVLWAIVIIFINILGPIVYFIVGREEATA